jgi:hypothetical protein
MLLTHSLSPGAEFFISRGSFEFLFIPSCEHILEYKKKRRARRDLCTFTGEGTRCPRSEQTNVLGIGKKNFQLHPERVRGKGPGKLSEGFF